ncbi:uncharacterized protein LOC111884673 isoform X2 [Lactuca sativa]|uniref:uncharacterized protein LOC111884673 isoform X2 n=1 Tax=Lactuca sativa TaxID=4236 RepID=UPI000CD9D354|nr:uncharacterized protein LOC111884673 isoform X2 [Lactuca sativa]
MSLFQGRFKNQKRKKLKHEFIQASYFQGIEKQFEYGFENQLPTFVLHLIHLLGFFQKMDKIRRKSNLGSLFCYLEHTRA